MESSPCVRLSRVDWREKFGTCAVLFQPRVVAQGVCEGGLDVCSAADVTRLDGLAACLDSLPACRPGLEEAWLREVTACDDLVPGVAPSFLQALPDLHPGVPQVR